MAPRQKGKELRRFGRAIPLALVASLLMAGVALADNIQINAVDMDAETDTITIGVGDTTTVSYRIQAQDGTNPNPDVGGCNVDDENPATITPVGWPVGKVTSSPTSRQYTECGTGSSGWQGFDLTGNVPGIYTVTTTTTGGKTDSFFRNHSFTLVVEAGEDECTDPVEYSTTFHKPFDGSSPAELINNTVKKGRVVPIKVEIFAYDPCEDTTTEVRNGTMTIAKSVTTAQGASNEGIEYFADAGAANSNTNEFRFDEAGDFWIYNFDTKGLTVNQSYAIDIWWNDGTGAVKVTTTTWGVITATK